MASGLPDHYRGIRPWYGGANLIGDNKVVTPDEYTTLVLVNGKGMVYGGIVWVDYTYSCANDIVTMLIDDLIITDLSFLRLKVYSVKRALINPVTLNKYDGINYVYSVGISYGLTFEKNVALYYKETYGRDPTVFYRFTYALV